MKQYLFVGLISLVIGLVCLSLINCASVEVRDRDVNVAIEAMREAKDTHQTFVDFPEFCNEKMGTVEFHKKWVKSYELVLSFLTDIKKEKGGN